MKILLIIAGLAAGLAGVKADESAFQASLTPDIAIHPSTTEIRGLSLNIWGENPQHGVALGFVNGSTGNSSGFSWAFIANYDDNYTGVHWGLVNLSKQSFVGWQAGFVNAAQGHFKGLQWGAVNYAENLHGVQIGFINVAENNSWFKDFPNQLAKGFPIVNWSF
jgi:hypothetical protein